MMKNNPDKITIVYAVNANIVPKGPIMLKQHYKVIFTLNMSKYFIMIFFLLSRCGCLKGDYRSCPNLQTREQLMTSDM